MSEAMMIRHALEELHDSIWENDFLQRGMSSLKGHSELGSLCRRLLAYLKFFLPNAIFHNI